LRSVDAMKLYFKNF